MSDVLSVKDKTYTILDPKDFTDILQEHLGSDASRYFENYSNKIENEADNLVSLMSDELLSYEHSVESDQMAFIEILDELEALEEAIFCVKRINKDKLNKILKTIKTIINNQV